MSKAINRGAPLYCGGPKQAKYWMEWLVNQPEVRRTLGYTPSIEQLTGDQLGIRMSLPGWRSTVIGSMSGHRRDIQGGAPEILLHRAL